MLQQTEAFKARVDENRSFERIELLVSGKIFDPANEEEAPCQVLSLSPGGAGISSASQYLQGTHLILYIDGFGRFEGDLVPHDAQRGEGFTFGLKFDLCRSKRDRVGIMLAQFVRGGLSAVTQLRATRRVRTNGRIDMRIGSGPAVSCELIDISLEGVALTTQARPPIGEVVQLGETLGQVVRHHETGIALRFLREKSSG